MAKDKNLRQSPPEIDMSAEDFRRLGHDLVDNISAFIGSIRERKVTSEITPSQSRELIDSTRSVPEDGTDPAVLLDETFRQLSSHSLFNGHPRFWGYITSSPAPIGMLAELLAAAINPNLGSWKLSPIATEIEIQTVRWIAEMIGYPTGCGGILVSGGNMANIVCFMAARTAAAGQVVRKTGLHDMPRDLTVYASDQTHTWIEKAMDMAGFGADSLRKAKIDSNQCVKIDDLRRLIEKDISDGLRPMMVIGTAGTVSTGAIDPLDEMAALCKEYKVWFHVDGAYGGFAAMASDAPSEIRALSQADSVSVDPHKWLYAPLEAGCALVRNQQALRDTFSYHPPYYHFGQEAINFVDFGPQNSRGFRALKIWLAIRQVGRNGYRRLIEEDIELARYMRDLLSARDDFEVVTCNLSIVTFRYLPSEMRNEIRNEAAERHLDLLNEELLIRLEKSGELFISNAVIDGRFLLRACIVNFRTRKEDIEAMPEIIARHGMAVEASLAPQ
jgi:glutamate/tyrosine decarboxylase-like PLP-dependent enzyme